MIRHGDEVLSLLRKQIGNDQEVDDIQSTAREVVKRLVPPLGTGNEQTSGLVYGLVQSGKTGVLSVTGAMSADEGYNTIIVLTSDNNALYDQTFGRIQEAFPGIEVLGKRDLKNATFLQRIVNGTCAIVSTKNSSMLGTLIDNFTSGNVADLSCLLIDDEADQASLNTNAAKDDGTQSAVNEKIMQIRGFFKRNTYLQVTATPQALFLQDPTHDFRPKFTVLSHPGRDYVGGKDFFGENSSLVHEFPINDLLSLEAAQSAGMPPSLQLALDTFIVAATYKRMNDAESNCSFLCHVSTRRADHEYIEGLLRDYKIKLSAGLRSSEPDLLSRLRTAYRTLSGTHPGLANTAFEELIEKIAFYVPSTAVKLVNGDTDEDVAVRAPFNLFVGGNKLGRGVTIKNLLVSYYGRNPQNPQADTVLQHARMYGYRRKDIGLLRLFLPPQLHRVFRAIYEMERSLRAVIEESPDEEFRGIFLRNSLSPTRNNILAPGTVGAYTGGSNYNPAQVARDDNVTQLTAFIDDRTSGLGNKNWKEVSVEEAIALLNNTLPDPEEPGYVWNASAIIGSMREYAEIEKTNTCYIYVDRERALNAKRRETAGVLEGGEGQRVPNDKMTVFLLRTVASGDKRAAWWPQVRFPRGRYAFAFSL